MALTHDQLTQLALSAGFPPADQDTAAAVALAESGGDPHAHNPVPPDDSYGLWQINMIGRLGPLRREALHLSSNAALYDPATNARAAYMIYRAAGSKFTPWTTYTSGAYRSHLTGGAAVTDQTRAKAMGALDKYNEAQKAALAANPWLAPFMTFTDNLRKQGWNALVIVVALVLVVLGVVILLRHQAKGAAKTIAKVLP